MSKKSLGKVATRDKPAASAELKQKPSAADREILNQFNKRRIIKILQTLSLKKTGRTGNK